jgi:DNA-binding GntR family transcriptional regulator
MARSAIREPAVAEAGQTAYRRLREAIASGQFHPNERLVEASVATRLGVGRTAVRAALVRLDQEGLVILEPNRVRESGSSRIARRWRSRRCGPRSKRC